MVDLENLKQEQKAEKKEFNFGLPKISVIIPAYNIEKYITDCLNSLKKQTLKEIEIIVVNDGSQDKTAEIVEIFAQNDSRIKLINQENQRVGMARNNGLKSAQGEYVIFVDSDDELDIFALENLYQTIKEKQVDIVIYGAMNLKEGKYSTGSYSVEKIPSNLKEKILNPEIIRKNIFKFPVLSMCKIYNRDFLEKNNIKFQDARAGEDQIFYLKAMLFANKIYVTNNNFYKYRRNRKDSLTFGKRKQDNSPILNFYVIEEFLKTSNFSKELKFKILNKYFVKAVSWLGKCDEQYKAEYFKDLKKLQQFLSQNYPEYYWKKVRFNQNSSYWGLKLNLFLKF